MDRKQAAANAFDVVGDELKAINRWMYENPELAFEETATSARLVGFLEKVVFDVEFTAYSLETAFAARAGSAGPEVIVFSEYDALREVGQACGHDIIATSALGAGHAG